MARLEKKTKENRLGGKSDLSQFEIPQIDALTSLVAESFRVE